MGWVGAPPPVGDAAPHFIANRPQKASRFPRSGMRGMRVDGRGPQSLVEKAQNPWFCTDGGLKLYQYPDVNWQGERPAVRKGRGVVWPVERIKANVPFSTPASAPSQSWSARVCSASHAVGTGAGRGSGRNSSSDSPDDMSLCRSALSNSAACRRPGRARSCTERVLKSSTKGCGSLPRKRAKT